MVSLTSSENQIVFDDVLLLERTLHTLIVDALDLNMTVMKAVVSKIQKRLFKSIELSQSQYN